MVAAVDRELPRATRQQAPGSLWQRICAYAVHVYTASGVAFAFFAAVEICNATPDVRRVFLLLFGAVVIDATDGTLARRWKVKQWAASIDGRTIDDLVDYLTYAFLPLLLMWRMDWLPHPAAVWIIPVLMASLFGFANRDAKDERAGFFLGFPSYWNIVAFYGGLWRGPWAIWVNAMLLLVLAVLTVVPVRFLYPNLTPPPWRWPIMLGALVWAGVIVVILVDYPHGSRALVWISLLYPAFYIAVSIGVSRGRRG